MMGDSPNIVIEEASVEDAEILYDLINKVYLVENGDTGEAFKTGSRFHSIDSILSPLKSSNVFKAVIKDTNMIIGVIVWEEKEDAVFFGPLGVSPNYQGLGIGTKLIKHIEQLAKNKKKPYLSMCVVNHRKALIESYKRMGFVATGVVEPYYEPQYLTRESTFVYFTKKLL